MTEVLLSKDRTRGGRTAPASGLFLLGVEYDQQRLEGGGTKPSPDL
jgi:hypothetical protein